MAAPTQLPYTLEEIQKVPAEMGAFGACSTENGKYNSLFFSDKKSEIKAAKEICGSCIMKNRCLEYAVANERYGVWGGLSENERAALRKNQGQEAVVTPEERNLADLLRQAISRGDKVADMAVRFEVTERTIYRWKARWLEDQAAAARAEGAIGNDSKVA